VLAHEFSGEVAATGGEVGDLSLGQNIYGLNDWFEDGAFAEYCVTKPASIALKPQRLTHAEAASVPIGALTAWQAYEHVG
jgi:NADPH:quinone reductase-like Zn-dependent oxidoreductase